MHDKNHLGLGNAAGEWFWCLDAFHFGFFILHKLFQETMFSKTKLSLAQRHQVIPCKQSMGRGKAQNMQVHERYQSARDAAYLLRALA